LGGDLVAASPQCTPGAPKLSGVTAHHSIMTQQNECAITISMDEEETKTKNNTEK